MSINLILFIIGFIIVFGGISLSAIYALHALDDVLEKKVKKTH